MKKADKIKKLEEINSKLIDLKRSPLYSYRLENDYFPVPGEGGADSKIMFIGEAPGRNEAKTGRPFCGAAGKVFDSLLESIKMKRDDVFVTNIVKDRPPKNRDPLPEEIGVYGPLLDEQIEILKPQMIVTLGRYSMKYILEKFNLSESAKKISEMHGKYLEAKAKYGRIKVVILYHPCVAIYNTKSKDVLKKDFKVITKLLSPAKISESFG